MDKEMMAEYQLLMGSLKKHFEKHEFESVENLLSDENFERFPSPYLYFYLALLNKEYHKDLEASLDAVEQGLAIHGECQELLDIKFSILYDLNRWEEAVSQGKLLLETYPKAHALWMKVANALKNINSDEADREAITCEAQAKYFYALEAYYKRVLDVALDSCEQALLLREDHYSALMLKPKILIALGRFEEAEAFLIKNLNLPEIEIDVSIELSLLAENKGEIAESAQYAERVFELDPETTFASKAQLKHTKITSGAEDALNLACDLLRDKPRDIWAHFVKFSCTAQLANDVHFLNSAPDQVSRWKKLSRWLESSLQYVAIEKSIPLIKELKTEEVDDEILQEVGSFFRKLYNNKKFQAVFDLYQAAPQKIKNNFELACFYGYAIGNVRYIQDAQKYFKNFVDRYPEDFEFRYHYAHWYGHLLAWYPENGYDEDDIKVASNNLILGINKGMGTAESMCYLGAMLAYVGRIEEAREWLVKSNELGFPRPIRSYWYASVLCDEGEYAMALEEYVNEYELKVGKTSDDHDKTALKDNILRALAREQDFATLREYCSHFKDSNKYKIGVTLLLEDTDNTLEEALYWLELAASKIMSTR